jgi:GNAT superfamily N-acetyltransferase
VNDAASAAGPAPVHQTWVLRAGRDDDAPGYIALIRNCWAEYPGCVFDLDGEVPELRALASYFAAKGGALWTAEADGQVTGMVAVAPADPAHDPGAGRGAWKLNRMYVAAGRRGGGMAQALLAAAEAHAVANGAHEMLLWSDTRFDRAHRFYEKHGYVRLGPILALGDKSNSIDFAYAKPLTGVVVRRLNAAGAASAKGRLAEVLRGCVDDGASVSFLPPLAPADALAFWQRIASDVAQGRRILLAGWLDGSLVGTVQLDLAMPPNQPHRADLQKLLVLPHARRRGVARALMLAAEREAAAAGRRLLVLDTRAGDAGEALYRSMGWQEVGAIPDFALNPDGTYCATVIFYRRVE